MPLSFPLSYNDFLGALPISSITMECPAVTQVSQTAGGEALPASIGNLLWQGEIQLGAMQRREKRLAQTLIDSVHDAGGSFFVNDVSQEFPQDDPSGSLLAGAAPKVHSLPLDTRLLSLWDLPAGYVLRRGDHLSFSYRTGPVRYALHRVVDVSVTANAVGTSPQFEVRPPLQPGAALDTAVQLIRPFCKAIILPDSVQPGRTSRFLHQGMSFRFLQTFR